MHSNSTIKKTSAILSRIYSRNISISFHPLSKPPYRSLTKRRNLPFLYSIVIIPKKESVLVVVPLQQEQDWYGYQFPSKETVHTVRVIQFGRRLKKIKPIYPHPKEDDIFSEERTIRLQRTTVYSPSSNDSFFGATWRLFNRGGGKEERKENGGEGKGRRKNWNSMNRENSRHIIYIYIYIFSFNRGIRGLISLSSSIPRDPPHPLTVFLGRFALSHGQLITGRRSLIQAWPSF